MESARARGLDVVQGYAVQYLRELPAHSLGGLVMIQVVEHLPPQQLIDLVEQVTGTVRWRESVAYMAGHGVARFFEIGAGKVLSGLVKRIAEGAVGIPVGAPGDIAAARNALTG